MKADVYRPKRQPPTWLTAAWNLLAPRAPQILIRALLRGTLTLPRDSRARRWAVLTAVLLGWELTARGDPRRIVPFWNPRCEWHWDATFRSLGFDEVYRGHEGVERALHAWNEIWSERSFVVREVLDGGSTWAMRVTAVGRGLASGAETQQDFTSVARLKPLIAEFRNFIDHEAALENAGLRGPGDAG